MPASPQKENGYTAIANEIMEALAKIRINGEARQMLDVVIRKTYGYNKKQDRISTSQFVEATGLPNYAIHKARHKLLKMGMIEVLPKKVTGITQKGNSQILTYSFQKDYTKWQPLPKKVTVTQKGNALLPKKVTNCNPKSDTQKKERQYTKDNTLSGKEKPDLITPIEYLNEKTKSHFDPKNKSNQDLVRVRYNEGRTLEQFKQVIDTKVAQWLNDDKMFKYLRPSTLFNRTNFENYLNEPKPDPFNKYINKKEC